MDLRPPFSDEDIFQLARDIADYGTLRRADQVGDQRPPRQAQPATVDLTFQDSSAVAGQGGETFYQYADGLFFNDGGRVRKLSVRKSWAIRRLLWRAAQDSSGQQRRRLLVMWEELGEATRSLVDARLQRGKDIDGFVADIVRATSLRRILGEDA